MKQATTQESDCHRSRSRCATWLGRTPEAPPTFETFDAPRSSRSPIFVSLSTVPARLPLIRPVLLQLIRQTQPADAVVLSVPYFSTRQDQCYRLPNFLRSDPELRRNITLLRSDEDYGPATKLIPLVKLLKASGLPGLQDALILVLVSFSSCCESQSLFLIVHIRSEACRMMTSYTRSTWLSTIIGERSAGNVGLCSTLMHHGEYVAVHLTMQWMIE